MVSILKKSDFQFYRGQGFLCTGCNETKGRDRNRISNEGIYRLLDLSLVKFDTNHWLCPECFQELMSKQDAKKKTKKRGA